MKNITLSADFSLIEAARVKASREHTTLNALFRRWLDAYVARRTSLEEYRSLMKRLSHIRVGRRFSRDDANER